MKKQYSKHFKRPEFDKFYYLVMKDDNNNASNILIWLALGQHFNDKLFFKNLASAVSYWSSDSLRYSNLDERFRTKLQDSIQCI